MAEIFLSPIIELLFEKVFSGLFSKLSKCGGIDESQLQKWKKTLSIIRAVLTDAEDKQIEDRSVQMWLDDLQALAYDLDDIIDELITEYSRHELKMKTQSATASTSSSHKVWGLIIPSCCTSFTPTAIEFNYNMGSKLEGITKRLQDLTDQKQSLGLKEGVGKIRSYGTRETTSLVVESGVWGRQTDKDKILELVCKDDEEVSVIPIVGMAGLGKTTLAQLVYNDDQVKERFDLKAWVCVSDEFDEFKITCRIFEWVSNETCEFKSLSMVQQSLKEKLSNKKFLLVLDDVWNEDYVQWDLLRTPFLVGAPGSKIIVTTRNEGVASIMRSPSIPTYHLTQLTKDDCVSILAQHALGTRDFELHPNLKVVGENIARKCNGSPLAAKTLGGLLRTTEKSTKAWENVLDSKFWELPAGKSGILPALRLSYHHLPPHLKRLFAYCSIFPKDYQFDKFELVLLWMAEGFLQQSKGKKQMEEIGFQHFNDLLSRSFFQHSSGDQSHFVMHDLMNDLAQFVAGQICFGLDDKMISNEQQTISEKARHLSSIRLAYGTFNKFEAFYQARSLRTILTLPLYKSYDWEPYHLSNKVVHELLPKLQCLRVLNLSGYSITELPNSIGDLIHLRYLNLSQTLIKQLPESVSNLFNLETLLLRSCKKLIKLPAKIGNLINLRHLDISDTKELQEMPSGINTLTSLQTLSKIVLDESNMLQLTELRGLSNLRGTFSIMGLQHVKNVQDARKANLLSKQGLEELMLIWSSEFNDSRNEQLEVLVALQPHTNLTKLKIVSYGGIEFSSWVGDRSFSNITHLTLEHCEKCTSLPPVGQLPSLRELCVWKMSGVKNVGVELCGNRHAEALSFPSLEILSFRNMNCWEEWLTDLTDVDGSVRGLYPCLRELTLRNCRKLVKVILPRIPSLRVLNIENCCEVVLSSMVCVASSVKTLKISGITGLISLRAEVVQSLASLEVLTIENCDELSYLWQEESLSQNLVNLKCLSVGYCPQLVSLAKEEHAWPPSIEELSIDSCEKLEKLPIWGNNLMSLRKLDIRKCPGLQSCPTMTDLQSNSSGHVEIFPHLEHLTISNCSSLTCLPTGQNLPTSLKSISIWGCSNLEPDSENFWLHSRCIPSLEEISIDEWVNLKVLPGCLFSFNRLTRLSIDSCPGLESFPERGFPPSLRRLVIDDCLNLKSLPDDVQMQRLTSLEFLSIRGCPSLESFPRGVWPPSLKKLKIGEVKQPISEWGLPTSLVSLEIEGEFPEVVCFPDPRSPFPTSLTTLLISGLVSLESLSMGLQNLTSLQNLYIHSCPKLQSLSMGLQNLTSLQELYISSCPKLQSLSMGLQNLTSLQELYINSGPKLHSLYTSGLQNPTSLHQLCGSSCPKLQSLPEKLLPTLSSLRIFECPLLEERCLKEKGCYWPLIDHIPYVEINDIKQ